jgi:hypothetical protein
MYVQSMYMECITNLILDLALKWTDHQCQYSILQSPPLKYQNEATGASAVYANCNNYMISGQNSCSMCHWVYIFGTNYIILSIVHDILPEYTMFEPRTFASLVKPRASLRDLATLSGARSWSADGAMQWDAQVRDNGNEAGTFTTGSDF